MQETLFTSLLDEVVCWEVVAQHKQWVDENSECQICPDNICGSFGMSFYAAQNSTYSLSVNQQGLDIYGNKPDPNCQKSYECRNCKRKFAAVRFAQHLDKCLGISGRSRRTATSSSFLRDRLNNAGAGEGNDSDSSDQNSDVGSRQNRKRSTATAIGKKQKHREDGEGNGRWAKDSSAINLDQFTNFDRRSISTPEMHSYKDKLDELAEENE